MNWGNAGQEAQRHIQISPGDRRQTRNQRGRPIIDVRQKPHATALVEAARDLRNVGGRIPVAEKRLEVRLSGLGKDLPVSFVVEAIDHHPIVTGELAEDMGRFVAKRLKIRRRHDFRNEPFEIDGQIGHLDRAFEFDDKLAIRRAMDKRRVRCVHRPNRACRRNRNAADIDRHAVAQPLGDRTSKRPKRESAQPVAKAEKTRGVLAFLNNDVIRFSDNNQRAVGLDRSGEMDLLPLAVGEICGAKSRRQLLFDR